MNIFYREFFSNYKNALSLGLYNCLGKEFLKSACQYTGLCHLNGHEICLLLFRYSTSIGDYQPGALSIKWSVSDRSSSTDRKKPPSVKDKYADFVALDGADNIHVIVAEVKKNVTMPIESQNNEQMLGLWSRNQKAMLGLELQGVTVRPKVLLLLNDTLNMFYLKELILSLSQQQRLMYSLIHVLGLNL